MVEIERTSETFTFVKSLDTAKFENEEQTS